MLRSTSRVALRLAQSSKVAVRAFGSNNIAFVATPLFKPTRVLAQEDFRERAPRVITEEIARRRVQIGNVTEDTKWYNIKEFFESVGPVKVAKLFTSKRPGDPTQTGFVEFENEESVDRAINELNEKSFNGSDLSVKAYRYISPEDAAARKVDREKNRSDARARTAFVSNVAYSVDENEVEEIFTSAGIEVERVSLPKNETGRGRGFGFVTFKSQDDLRRAVEEVNNKNVAGRVITVSPSADRN